MTTRAEEAEEIASEFPAPPTLEETLELLRRRYGFRASELRPAFRWVERRREVHIPGRLLRFVVEAHYVVPSINLHLIHVRVRWVHVDGFSGPDDCCREHEFVEFKPWAPYPYPANVKDLAFGRWAQ